MYMVTYTTPSGVINTHEIEDRDKAVGFADNAALSGNYNDVTLWERYGTVTARHVTEWTHTVKDCDVAQPSEL